MKQDVVDRLLAAARVLDGYGRKILTVGAYYPGIWLEHNQDNEFFVEYDPETAWNSQTLFLDFQREDGLIPCAFKLASGTEPKFPQIQCVRSFVRSALEVARKCGRPEEDYARIYQAGCRYEEFLARYRNRAGSGLVEMFCEFDTGHDNSPRVTDGGIPPHCADRDAAKMPDIPCMPVLSVDLSAMSYGNRTALAEIAGLLGDDRGAKHWQCRAEEGKEKMRQLLYDPEDDFYYDRDRFGLRKYRTEYLTRLFLNGVTDPAEFDRLYDKWMDG